MPLGSNDRWSSGIELQDVAMNLVAFEAMNNVRLLLQLSVADYHGQADILVSALAYKRGLQNTDQVPLASANVSCLGTHLRSLEGALIHALYMLDGQLVESALAEVKNK